MEGRELPQRATLSEQPSGVNSSGTRDHPKGREEDPGGDSASPGPVVACEKREGSVASGGSRGGGRRLFDIIQQVHHANKPAADGTSNTGTRWRSLRDRIRRAGAAWAAASSAHPCPISDPELLVAGRRNPNPALCRSVSRSASIRNPGSSPYPISDPELVSSRSNPVRPRSVSSSVSVRNSEPPVPELPHAPAAEAPPAASRGGSEEISVSHKSVHGVTADSSSSPAAAASGEDEEQPAKMSLMALLEQTDMQWGSGDEEEEAEEDDDGEEVAGEDEGEGGGDGMLYVCCVCMVRHKGAAFIPCGHTFCRLCSRELWVSRGNCPLCNGYILEILDIF